ncbi:MAG: hypothetical protein ACE5DO_15130, partial [Desulfobacterales bacterium]
MIYVVFVNNSFYLQTEKPFQLDRQSSPHSSAVIDSLAKMSRITIKPLLQGWLLNDECMICSAFVMLKHGGQQYQIGMGSGQFRQDQT